MQPELSTDPESALVDLLAGATVMVAGQQGAGVPASLLGALLQSGVNGLTIICEANSPEVLKLIAAGQVAKLVCPPIDQQSWEQIQRAGIQIEPLPAGTLAERIRAAGAGIGSFLMETYGSESLHAGKERQELDGRQYVVETPLRADYALLRAHKADTLGNLIYQGSARNWNPNMATAAATVVVEVDEVVEPGELDQESVITPGIFIDRIICSQLPGS
jgi:3-oxoadipate CoA-transferase alpha subunit